MSYYVNNDELKQLIKTYNDNNIYDDCQWTVQYIKKLETKKVKQTITLDEYQIGIQFIKDRLARHEQVMEEYSKMTPQEKIKFDDDLTFVRDKLFKYFRKIVVGRINSLGIRNTINDPTEMQDMISNGLVTLFEYINRFDSNRSTSAFAYVTQLAHNSVIHDINEYNRRNGQFVSVDYYNNMNTIDDCRGEDNFKNWTEA